ncbi:hypothetical protein Tco_0022115 [Tanacetum coccineum]
MNEDKIKKDLEEIETINIELDHRVSKLIAENEHLKQTHKQLYKSIKPARIRSKEQCDDLINQVNLKSVEIFDLNASLQEKVLVITDLKDDLRKLKGKTLVDNDVTKHPEMLKIDVEPITPKLLIKKIAQSAYIKHTQEEATVLRDLVKHVKTKYPLDHSLEFACRYAKLILFDELTAMDSEHSSSGPALHELLTPPPSVDHPAPEVIAPTADIVAPVPAASTGLPSLTTVDQDAPSPSNSQTTPETQSPIIPNDVKEDYHDIEVAHMGNDPYFVLGTL